MNQGTLWPMGPTAPFAPGSSTSRAAAQAVAARLPKLQAEVLEFVRARGARGATREELEQGLNMSGNTVRPRVKELLNPYRAGGPLLRVSDERRPTRSGMAAEVLVARAALPPADGAHGDAEGAGKNGGDLCDSAAVRGTV